MGQELATVTETDPKGADDQAVAREFDGELLARLRTAKGWTQADLGRLIGGPSTPVHYTTVARWEKGERDPSFSAVVRIAREIGISVLAFVKPPRPV